MTGVINAKELSVSIKKINTLTVEEQVSIADDIKEYQPVILASFLTLQNLVNDQNQLGRLFYIMLVVWDAFSNFPALKTVKITDELQEKLNESNIGLLKFLDGEADPTDFKNVVDHQIRHYRQAHTLAFMVQEIVEDEMGIFNMPLYLKGQLILYLKTVVDCIDHVIDYSDVPELDDTFWDNAVIEYPERKKPVTLRLVAVS